MQVQFGLGQRRLRLFQTGFGLGNLLRAVTGAILTQLILRRFERRLFSCGLETRKLRPAMVCVSAVGSPW